MEQVLASLEEDLRTLRPGRASAELVTSLPVACYGGSMPLAQLGSVANNDEGQLVIQVWDKTVQGAVETAIRESQLGFSVTNDGSNLRLSLPPLSQERRQELVKLVHQKGEAARVALRQARTDALQQANRAKTAGELREDDLNRLTKDLNEAIDGFNSRVKQLVDRKEHELMTV